MNSQNLNPYKPGQSGNPKGKPKGAKNFSTSLKRLLAGIDDSKDKNWTNPLAKKLIQIAFGKFKGKDKDGNDITYSASVKEQLTAVIEMLDRNEGKAKQNIQIDSEVNALPANIVIQGKKQKEK